MTNLTDEQRAAVGRVEKLLRLAGRNTNEAEAASATAKAMEMLVQYNLDLSTVEREGAEAGGARTQEKLVGGFYQYERDLWMYVADLNFCMYWSQSSWMPREKRDARSESYQSRHLRENVRRQQHRLVGRVVNVRATQVMAEYLLQAIERVCRDWLLERGQGDSPRSRRAVSFREGVAERLCEKIYERRREMLREEERVAAEARARAAEAGMSGVSDSTAVTLSSLRKSEDEANADHLWGEGYSAKKAARRAAQAAADRAAEEEYTRWAAAHPKEAARAEREREKEAIRASRRGPGSRGGSVGKDRDWGSYSAGHRAGDGIGLDLQAGRSGAAGAVGQTRKIGHG